MTVWSAAMLSLAGAFWISRRWRVAGPLLLLVVLPLAPKVPLLAIMGTYIAIRLDDFVCAGVILAAALRRAAQPGWSEHWHMRLNLPVLVFLGATLAASVAGILQGTALPNLAVLHWARRLQYLALLYVTMDGLRTPTDRRLAIRTVLFTAATATAYGWLQRFDLVPVFPSARPDLVQNTTYFSGYGRVISTFGGPYEWGAYGMVLLPLCLSLWLGEERGPERSWALWTGLLLWPMFYEAQSRTALLGLIMAVGVVLWQHRRFRWIGPAVGAVALPALLYEPFAARLLSVWLRWDISSPLSSAAAGDPSWWVRFYSKWPAALDAFRLRPLLGAGPGAVSEAVDGDYIRALAETGLIGAAAFVILLACTLLALRSYTRQTAGWDRTVGVAVLAAFSALLLQATLIDIFESSKIATLIWALVGLTGARTGVRTETVASERHHEAG